MSSSTSTYAYIQSQLDQLRRSIARYIWIQVGILVGIAALALFWLMAGVDYFPVLMGASESPRWARLTMLMILVALVLTIVIRWGIQRGWVRWRDTSLALLLERRFPQLQSSLITTVEAHRHRSVSDAALTRDAQLLAISEQQAFHRLRAIDVDEVLWWDPLRWQTAVLGGLLAFSALFIGWQPAWTWHWAKRLFALSNQPWPRQTQLALDGIEIEGPRFAAQSEPIRYRQAFVDGRATLPRGQSARLLAHARTDAPQVPESCLLSYRSDDGRQGRASLRRLSRTQRDRVAFVLEGPPLESVAQPLSMSLQGGDVRLAGLRLDLLEPPQLSRLELQVQYPRYLQRGGQSVWLDETLEYRTGLRLPEGTLVSAIGIASSGLSHADVRVTSRDREGNLTAQDWRAEGQDQQVRLELGALQANWQLEYRLWDTAGHCSLRVQPYALGLLADEVPILDLALQGIGTAVTANAVLPLKAKVTDDHGVAEVWAELFLNETPPVALPLQPTPAGELTQQLDLRSLREAGTLAVAVGQTLGLTLVARDEYDLATTPHTGRASPMQLAIVTPDQLLVLLDRRELAMGGRMELVSSELTQLRELLTKIRQVQSEPPPQPAAPSTPDGATSDTSSIAPDGDSLSKLQELRAQQALAQAEKSHGELEGVIQEIAQIRAELINNRIESQDRQARLDDKVRKPLSALVDGLMAAWIKRLSELERGLGKGPVPDQELAAALADLDQILAVLAAIRQDMLDIQDFAEVVDMVRGMLDDQKRLIDETKAQQKERVMDLFKP